jgi:hypothetical protein
LNETIEVANQFIGKWTWMLRHRSFGCVPAPRHVDKARFLNASEISPEESRYCLILTERLGYGQTRKRLDSLEKVSRLLNAYSKAILDSSSDFSNPRAPNDAMKATGPEGARGFQGAKPLRWIFDRSFPLVAMIKAIKAATVWVFAFIIVCPFLQEHLHVLQYRALQENRLKIPRPMDWRTLFAAGTPFAKKYEEYFNDNYGLRDLLICANNQLDYLLFRKSDRVLIGPDNWLFYKSVVEEEILAEQTRNQFSEPMYARFLKLNQMLAARGITLVIVPCPMKNTIYPEKLPSSAPRRPSPTAFDRYRMFLGSHPEIVTIDAVPILMKLKKTFQAYHKTDFHWNDPAGAYVAKELVNKLGNLSGKGNVWNQPVGIWIQKILSGDESLSLALLWPIQEDALFFPSDHIETGLGKYTVAQGANSNEWSYQTTMVDDSRLIPNTVMFGDSFADAFLRAGFTAYFSHFQKYYNSDFRKRFALIPDGTRFVIFQHIETSLIDLQNPLIWPEEIVGKEPAPD